MDKLGAVVSGGWYVMLSATVVLFRAGLLSIATTVNLFVPIASVPVQDQLAVLAPVALPLLAACPFTVTAEIPLLPCPESVAVPRRVIELDVTVIPFA